MPKVAVALREAFQEDRARQEKAAKDERNAQALLQCAKDLAGVAAMTLDEALEHVRRACDLPWPPLRPSGRP